jgi:hypothetical protein
MDGSPSREELTGVSRRRDSDDNDPASPGAVSRASTSKHFEARDVLVSTVAWTPRVPLSAPRWVEYGRRLGRLGTGVHWWLGDWVRYAAAAPDRERYRLAAKLTGYEVQTLMNLAYVASRLAAADRRPEVSWSHHSEVAALTPDQQRQWLDRVSSDRLSQKDLRRELRRAGLGRRPGPSPSGGESSPPITTLCPTCGQPLPAVASPRSFGTGVVDANRAR